LKGDPKGRSFVAKGGTTSLSGFGPVQTSIRAGSKWGGKQGIHLQWKSLQTPTRLFQRMGGWAKTGELSDWEKKGKENNEIRQGGGSWKAQSNDPPGGV